MKNFTPKLGILLIVFILGVVAVVIYAGRDQDAALVQNQNASFPSDAPTLAANAENYIVNTSPDPNAPKPETPPAISVYIYPGSQNNSTGSASLQLSSTDSAEEITDWYKSKINELKFNAKSFAQSSTNGEVFNKLSAAKPGEKLEVSIKKDQNTSNVLITVDRP